MAVANSMIVIGFYLIKHNLKFLDLGAWLRGSPRSGRQRTSILIFKGAV
jgi:hypothetical protein